MFNNNKDFDADLAKGQRNEKRICDILGLGKEKVEIKTEYGYWKKSGNLCIELESYGKPSGIKATKAKFWVHCFNEGEVLISFFCLPVKYVKQIVKTFIRENKDREYQIIRMLGDNNASKCVLIPITEFVGYWRELEKEAS